MFPVAIKISQVMDTQFIYFFGAINPYFLIGLFFNGIGQDDFACIFESY